VFLPATLHFASCNTHQECELTKLTLGGFKNPNTTYSSQSFPLSLFRASNDEYFLVILVALNGHRQTCVLFGNIMVVGEWF